MKQIFLASGIIGLLCCFQIVRPPTQTVTLPPVTAQQLNIILSALEECDCPKKTTPELVNSFLAAARQQQPSWFPAPAKVDTAKTKKP